MRAILAAHNSRHELWDQNRFTNTCHLKPVNVSKNPILGPKTNQTDWRQPFNVFSSQISFLFCSKNIYIHSGQLACEACATNLHTFPCSRQKYGKSNFTAPLSSYMKQSISKMEKDVWLCSCRVVLSCRFSSDGSNRNKCYKTTVTRYSLS